MVRAVVFYGAGSRVVTGPLGLVGGRTEGSPDHLQAGQNSETIP
jgi:hypothetical protein